MRLATEAGIDAPGGRPYNRRDERFAWKVGSLEAGEEERGMPLFSKKPKVNLESFCSKFFDSQILDPPVLFGEDGVNIFFGTVRDLVIEVDPSFAPVTLPALRREINALYTELFGLAFDRVVKKDSLCLKVSNWTKQYLEERGAADMWVGTLVYNQTIAQSGHETVQGKRSRMANTTFLNSLRWESFKAWAEAAEAGRAPFAGIHKECMGRVANRLGTEVAWNKDITLAMLVSTLLEQLGAEANAEARFRLRATLFGLYEGARKSVASVSFDVPRGG